MKTVRYSSAGREAYGPIEADAFFDLRRVGKIVGVGLNYRDHATETGLPLPKEPTLFMKATSALCGPNDDLIMPRGASRVDWEVELGIVIGRPGVYIAEREALDHVLGYVLVSIFRSAIFNSIAVGTDSREKAPTPSPRLGPGLRAARKSPIRRTWRCGCPSMESSGKTARPAT